MSKMLQVRNVPDEVHEALRRRAASEGLSLSEFVLRELQRVISRPPVGEVLARGARRGKRVDFREAVRALQAERAGRE